MCHAPSMPDFRALRTMAALQCQHRPFVFSNTRCTRSLGHFGRMPGSDLDTDMPGSDLDTEMPGSDLDTEMPGSDLDTDMKQGCRG